MPNARRLLVVDDDQDLRDTLTEQLALYDEFEILSADTAASAINQAKADRIDLAIVDVALPDMDGRGGQDHAPQRLPQPDNYADGASLGGRHRTRPRGRRQRLRGQAIQVPSPPRPHSSAASAI